MELLALKINFSYYSLLSKQVHVLYIGAGLDLGYFAHIINKAFDTIQTCCNSQTSSQRFDRLMSFTQLELQN